MKVYTNNKINGYYPVGASAVVVALSNTEAAEMLEERLESMGLKQTVSPKDMRALNTNRREVRILNDGDY